jgi:hypothetical protein
MHCALQTAPEHGVCAAHTRGRPQGRPRRLTYSALRPENWSHPLGMSVAVGMGLSLRSSAARLLAHHEPKGSAQVVSSPADHWLPASRSVWRFCIPVGPPLTYHDDGMGAVGDGAGQHESKPKHPCMPDDRESARAGPHATSPPGRCRVRTRDGRGAAVRKVEELELAQPRPGRPLVRARARRPRAEVKVERLERRHAAPRGRQRACAEWKGRQRPGDSSALGAGCVCKAQHAGTHRVGDPRMRCPTQPPRGCPARSGAARLRARRGCREAHP